MAATLFKVLITFKLQIKEDIFRYFNFLGVVRVQSLDLINSRLFINKANAKEMNELDMKQFLTNAVLSTDDRIPSSIHLGHLEVSRHIET